MTAQSEGDLTNGGEAAGRALVDAGVRDLFGVHGYINPVIESASRSGAEVYHFRHEQSAGFAADAYARVTRRPGVCFASASAGHANYLAPLSQAYGALSPVVLLVGQHGTAGDGMGILQEGYATENLRSVSKWTHRVTDGDTAAHWVSRALREAVSYPPGPVVLEFPLNSLAQRFEHSRKWAPARVAPNVPVVGPNPTDVDAVFEHLLTARRPLIIAGDGVHWSGASVALRELSELACIPTSGRRTARGAVPEGEALGHGAGARSLLIRDADVVCLIGVHSSELEGWFEPPDWPSDASYVQVNETPDEIWYGLPTVASAAGSSRLVVEALVRRFRQHFDERQPREAWLEELDRAKWADRATDAHVEARSRLQKRQALPAPDGFQISTAALTGAIARTMDQDATVVFDSYTGSLYLTDDVQARRTGQVLDAGPRVALGQGVGMLVGALTADPSHPAVTLVGDGGFGISGLDIETLVTYGLPGVVVIHNNATWGGTSLRQDLFHPDLPDWDTRAETQYGAIAEAMGAYSETVDRLEDLEPALERALACGGPAVVDVRADDAAPRISDPWMRLKITDIAAKGYASYPDAALEMFRSLSPRAAVRLRKSCLDNGVNLPIDALSGLTGIPEAELRNVPIEHRF